MAEEQVGRLEKDPLFLALTRPAIVLGVTYLWLSAEGMLWSIVFINTSDFSILIPGALITHGIGYLICEKEPRMMEMIQIWTKVCTKCRNVQYHAGTHSFDPY